MPLKDCANTRPDETRPARPSDHEPELHRVQLQAVLNHLTEGLVICDLEGRMLHWNPAALKIHGFTTEEEWRRRLPDFADTFELSTPDGKIVPVEQWPLTRILRGEIVCSCELQARRRDRPDWLRCWSYGGALAPGTDGQPPLAVITITDITGRKEAGAALRASEARLRLFIENAPTGIAIFDREMRYLAVSRRWIEDHHAAGNLLGRSHYEVFPDLPERWRAVHRRGLAGEVITADEDRYDRADGTTQWMRWEVHPWRTGAGEIGGIMIVVDEITERKRAAQALRESEARFRDMANTAPAIVWMTDALGRTTYFSQGWFDLTGQSEAAAYAPDGWLQLAHPEERELVRETCLAAAARQAPFELAYRVRQADGEYRWFLDAGHPRFNRGGEFIGYIGSLLDITARKQAEQALQLAHDEMERRVTERTAELLASHRKLNNEIAERRRLQDEIESASERERARLGRDLHDGLSQLLVGARLKTDSLVKQLAEHSPADVPRAEAIATLMARAVEESNNLARGLDPVAAVPEGLMTALTQFADATDRLFGADCACDFPQPVLVPDHKLATELFRIAQEATNNAIKHGHAGTIRIGLTATPGHLILTITNDGQPFPERPRTTGLGLKTMAFRADRIGATLDIGRGPDGGTMVRCTLPGSPAPAARPATS